MAWERVEGNKGARSAGVDGKTAASVRERIGAENFLTELRDQLRSRSFCPLPVRERMIPKPGSRKRRRLGIPTVADRVVQASLKLVLEPILEADFEPCSYGFRPNRRAHDAMAETRFLASKSYEWVLEGDITACFDEISHSALMDRVRARVADKRVLALVKAFLKAGILTEIGTAKESVTGTPQGGIMTPPTQLATSVLRCRWVIGVSNCHGVSVRGYDMSSSMLVTCLLVGLPVTVALVVTCSPSGSTPPRTCWTRVCRQPTPRESWPAGSAVRPGRRTATCSAPAGPDMLRCPPRPRCSPSSCRCRSSRGSVRMPPRRGGRCRRWSRRRWRSSWRGRTESIPAGERAGGRDRVRLRSPVGRGIVGGLPHPCPRTTLAQRARWSGSEPCR
jgi:Reverse transcriptase (RNA-dependent DNA polymerase)